MSHSFISKVGVKSCFLSVLAGILSVGGGWGCGGGGVSEQPTIAAQGIQTTIGELNIGSAAEVSFGSDHSAQVSFSDLTGNERFIIAFYSLSRTSGSFSASLQNSFVPEPSEEDGGVDEDRTIKGLQDRSSSPYEKTEEFHEMLRRVERNLEPPSEFERSRHLGIGSELESSLSVGDTKSVKVLNSLSSTESYTSVMTQVVYITDHFIVLRDNNASSLISNREIEDLIDPLESNVEAEHAAFGDVSDVDGNGKMYIVFSPVLNGLGGSGGIVTGYFFGGDLTSAASSNMGEYIYCHVPDPSGIWGVPIPRSFYISNTGPHCMPHEIQHAINYHMKNGATDPGWANEGQSHLAEDLYNDFESVSMENPSRVNLCLGSQLASFTGGTNLAQRGCSYLWYRYLYEQADHGRFAGIASGKDLIRKLHENNRTGLDSIEEVSGETIDSIASDFFVALYLSNTGLSTDRRYNFSGINLRSSQDDNRGTTLSGPAVSTLSQVPSSQSIAAMSANYSLITADTLFENEESITLMGTASMVPGAHLIRVQDL